MTLRLRKSLLDQLERSGWNAHDMHSWAKDGYFLTINKLQNDNFAVEIRKMSVVNVKLMSIDELERFIEAPSITYKP